MKRLLLTRQRSIKDVEFFEQKGYLCEILPLSELVLLELTAEQLADLDCSDWVFFTSQMPVQLILAHMKRSIKIACIGQKTAEEVRKYGAEPDFISSQSSKSEMIAEWCARFPNPAQIFYPMSDLAEPLQIPHALVRNAICYENRKLPSNLMTLEKLLSTREINAVYLTSPSSWQRFYSVYRHFDFPLEFIAIGRTTQRAIAEDGFFSYLKEDL